VDPLNYYHFNQRQPAGFEKAIPTYLIGRIMKLVLPALKKLLPTFLRVPAGVCSSSGWLYSEFGGFSSCPEAQVYDLVGVVPLLELGVSD
jgi:hypothetical protein